MRPDMTPFCLTACCSFSRLISLASRSSVRSSIFSMDTRYWQSSTTTTSGCTARIVFTTSLLLSSLKWAVPTTYTLLPSSATSSVTVRGRLGRSRRLFSFISRSRLKASTSDRLWGSPESTLGTTSEASDVTTGSVSASRGGCSSSPSMVAPGTAE